MDRQPQCSFTCATVFGYYFAQNACLFYLAILIAMIGGIDAQAGGSPLIPCVGQPGCAAMSCQPSSVPIVIYPQPPTCLPPCVPPGLVGRACGLILGAADCAANVATIPFCWLDRVIERCSRPCMPVVLRGPACTQPPPCHGPQPGFYKVGR